MDSLTLLGADSKYHVSKASYKFERYKPLNNGEDNLNGV